MKLFKKRSALTDSIPLHVQKIIREGLFNWVENRDYRCPVDSIATLAESIGVAPYQIAEYLQSYVGIKYCTLRKKLRIMDASYLLLLYSEKPLRHIGRMVGINDPSNFRMQFRKGMNLSPLHWRKSILVFINQGDDRA